MEIIVREASLKDVPYLLDFQLKMALETENIQLEIRTLTEGMHRLMKDPTRGKYYVAQAENEIVGCLLITREWSEWRCGDIWWIQSVYVASSWRGKGVFTRLYGHIRTLVMEDHDLKGIRLYVEQNNQPAIEVYKKLGMNGEHYRVFEWMKDN